jgi:hypothetical protein
MRDLEKDKEICDRAMPGPWIRKYVNNIEQAVTGRGICSCGYQNNGDVVKTALENANNMEFIADARKGWPHAIERAIKAEAEVERLQVENALLRAELESFYYPRTALLKDLAELDKEGK